MSWIAIYTTAGPRIIQVENIFSIGPSEVIDPAHPSYNKTAIRCGNSYCYYTGSTVEETVTFIVNKTRKHIIAALDDYRQIIENHKKEPADELPA